MIIDEEMVNLNTPRRQLANDKDWLEDTMETDESPPDSLILPPSVLAELSPRTSSLLMHVVTPKKGDDNLNVVYTDLQKQMETIKSQEQYLQTEIVNIKGRFQELLQTCGLQNDFLVSSQTFDDLCHLNPNINNLGMSTPRKNARQDASRRRTPDNNKCMYAELLIEQLLAQARSLTDSSDFSCSPPDSEDSPSNISHKKIQLCKENVDSSLKADANMCVNLCTENVNVFSKDDISRVPAELQKTGLSADNNANNNSSSNSSNYAATCSSSENQVVLDLEKELVSRMHYYSDFTIDRQKKIDQAIFSSDINDENVPLSSSDQSSEGVLNRCVEGSEQRIMFKFPQPTEAFKIPHMRHRVSHTKKSHRKCVLSSSSEFAESDTSSGTGSMPLSCASSKYKPLPGHHSYVSLTGAASWRKRTSTSLQGSHSSHPLASSTFISDPSSSDPSSLDTGSVYTWSMENSPESENLQKSYLHSKGRLHKYSRKRNMRVSQSNYFQKPSTRRPLTSVGADSPPQEKSITSHSILQLSCMTSASDTPIHPQSGDGFVNSKCNTKIVHAFRNTLPRTSTRINLFSSAKGDMYAGKSSSAPELSTSVCPDRNTDNSAPCSSSGENNLTEDIFLPVRERLEPSGKSSSTNDSAPNSYADCHGCNSGLDIVGIMPRRSTIAANTGETELLDLTDSPRSYDSSGFHPPCNSYTSPIGSNTGYSTISSWSSGSKHRGDHVPPVQKPRPQKVDFVFKVPRTPMRMANRRLSTAFHPSDETTTPRFVPSTHSNIGADPVMRRKLFATTQSSARAIGYQPPKIHDKKALLRKFKKFSTNFYKKNKIKTLANL